jgi:hypothetical protein
VRVMARGWTKGRQCTMAGCCRKHYAMNLCRMHYARLKRQGDPSVVLIDYWSSDSERFWRHVDKSHPSGCWLWTAGTRKGYGRIAIGRTSIYAHRFAFSEAYGVIPDGLFVCHRCDVPLCVRPDHLFLGTPRDNIRDSVAKGRHSSCTQVRARQPAAMSADGCGCAS